MSPAGISAVGRDELTRVLNEARRFVTPDQVVAALGVDREGAAQRLSRWARQGWLRRVRRGLYIPVPVDAPAPGAWSDAPMAVAAEVWSPCYFTGWTAANYWGMTEQVFRTTVLKTARRVRAAEVRLLDHDYLLTHAAESDMVWGLESLWEAGTRLRIADPARTVVDILDSPRLAGGIRHVADILGSYLDEHDAARLVDYGDIVGNGTVFKRLGYLVESLQLPDHGLSRECEKRLSTGVSLLDPQAPAKGSRSMRWQIRINVRINPVDAS